MVSEKNGDFVDLVAFLCVVLFGIYCSGCGVFLWFLFGLYPIFRNS